MINSTYLYFILLPIIVSLILYLVFNLKGNKTDINNKILLKDLLESFDLELPEELKRLEKSSTDPQNLS